mgnify:CR=1 FL=1
MKKLFKDFLFCLKCHGALDLNIDGTEGAEIKRGSLFCARCKEAYPIKDFIPRFVNTDEYADTFSFEWNRFYDVQIDILNNTEESERTFRWKTGWKLEDLRGKLILDVGVGAGRFADVVSRWGGEVVGIDLSFAVDAACKNIGRRDNVHLIQADIFNLPFEPETFRHVFNRSAPPHTGHKKGFSKRYSFSQERRRICCIPVCPWACSLL